MSATSTTNALVPPVAPREAHITSTVHGPLAPDYYFYMRERENARVLEHLRAEKAYSGAVQAQCEALRATVFGEFRSRMQESDVSAPFRRTLYEYYTRTVENLQYKIHCRRRLPAGAEEVLLDLNVEFTEHAFRSLALFRVSPDESKLAFSLDVAGDESFTVHIKDLATGRFFDKKIERINASLEWANDNATLFYDQMDATRRPFQIWRTAIDAAAAPAELLFTENDGAYEMLFRKSSSSRFIIVSSRSGLRASHLSIDCDQPAALPVPVVTRDETVPHLSDIDHWRGPSGAAATDDAGYWFIVSNRDAQREFALYYTPVSDSAPANWRHVLPYSESNYLLGLQVFARHLVVSELSGSLRRIKVFDLAQFPTFGAPQYIEFEEPVHTLVDVDLQTYDGPLRFIYSSYTTPDITYEYDFATGARTAIKTLPVPNFDPSLYVTELIFATSHDGTQVPIAVVRKRGAVTAPKHLHLYGYSSYGINVYPRFDAKIFSLVDRDWIFAVAHARGSSIMGRHWYENGKFEHKRNTFLDFNACADHLVRLGMTKPALMSIEGRSAGGLLVGACLNLNPEMCRVAIAAVPFVDVVQTMMDPTIPLTVLEYLEWGDPTHPSRVWFDAMLAYSPIDNIRSGALYPHTFVKAGLNDPRVQYWEPAKWVQKLRHEMKQGTKRVIAFEIHLGSGHFGSSGRYAYLEERASELAFLLHFMEQEE
jgi:oligopeptidase B